MMVTTSYLAYSYLSLYFYSYTSVFLYFMQYESINLFNHLFFETLVFF